MKLFLDDYRQPVQAYGYTKNTIYLRDGWVVVKNYEEFVNFIRKNSMPELISFDHDLADMHYQVDFVDWHNHSSEELGVEETGLDCAKFLINWCMDHEIKLPPYLVHSMNPAGKENIEIMLKNYEKYCSS